MKKYVLILLLLVPAFTLAEELAEPTQTKAKRIKLLDTANESLDSDISNTKLLTQSGSKSRFSLSVVTGYTGGSLKDPSSKDQPDLFGGDIKYQVSAFIDNSLRYRLNKNKSISLGYGASIIQPFHQATGAKSNYRDKFEFTNPYLNFSHFAGAGQFMYSYALSLTYYTQSIYKDFGYQMKPIVSGTLIYNFNNPFQIGLALDSGVNVFNSNLTKMSGAFDVTFGWHPFIEYQLRDNINIRTNWSSGLSHSVYELQGSDRWVNNRVSQSFGLGYNYNRNTYIYPNVTISAQDFYKKTNLKKSIVGVSATVNIF